MDEATFILTGRFLIEHGAVYADALDWTYGSYLWSLVAAYAAMAGGLALVRLIVAVLGAIMVLATSLAAARLAPAGPDRWIAALYGSGAMPAWIQADDLGPIPQPATFPPPAVECGRRVGQDGRLGTVTPHVARGRVGVRCAYCPKRQVRRHAAHR